MRKAAEYTERTLDYLLTQSAVGVEEVDKIAQKLPHPGAKPVGLLRNLKGASYSLVPVGAGVSAWERYDAEKESGRSDVVARDAAGMTFVNDVAVGAASVTAADSMAGLVAGWVVEGAVFGSFAPGVGTVAGALAGVVAGLIVYGIGTMVTDAVVDGAINSMYGP